MSERLAHEQFMKAALEQAQRAAEIGEFPVGSVLVSNGTVIAQGFRRNSVGTQGNEIDHAEIITLRQLIHHHHDYDLKKVTLYSTMEPCLMCFSTLILSGVRTIVYGYEDAMGGGTKVVLTDLPPLYADMKVKVIPNILRDQCLKLFKKFFSDTQNDYWKDSLLAQYTLEQ